MPAEFEFGRLARYALAFVLVVAAFVVTALVKTEVEAPSFMSFVPVIALVAWRAGRGPAIIATALSLFLIDWFFLPPEGLGIEGSIAVLDTLAFVILAITIIVATDALRTARHLAERRAFELERAATQASRLLDVTTALSKATTVEEVTTAALSEGLTALEATRAALVRVQGNRVELLGARGYDVDGHECALWTADELDTPLIASLREVEPIWVRSADDYRRRFPAAFARYGAVSATHTQGATPLVYLGETIGAISFTFTGASAFGVLDQTLIVFLAQAAAAALQRATNYDDELRRRHDAELQSHAREEVLGVVAHDLRNPLNVIGSSIQMLVDYGVAPDSRRRLEDACLRAVKHMNRLISDLLDSVRLQAGRLTLDVQDLSVETILEHAEETFRPVADSRRIRLAVERAEAASGVRADAMRISQVLGNLLGNALKFTPPGGTVRLSTRTSSSGEVMFQVTDSGPGIAAADLQHVFQDFWQARRDDPRGVGLGLGIAKGLVEAQGGTIWVESISGKGATFSFTLPAAAAPERFPAHREGMVQSQVRESFSLPA